MADNEDFDASPEITKDEFLGRMTLEEYEKYKDLKDWQLDNPDFEDETEWEKAWVEFVETRIRESRDGCKNAKEEWARVLYRYQQFDRKDVRSPSQADPSDTDIPFVKYCIDDRVAQFCDSAPIPVPVARQETQEKFVAGLGAFLQWELEANGWDMKLPEVATDMDISKLGIMKFSFDETQKGPYGNSGRVVVEQLDPRYFHPDPLAKAPRFEYMSYFAYVRPEDKGKVQGRFPEYADIIEADEHYSSELDKDRSGKGDIRGGGRIMISPANYGRDYNGAGDRQRTLLKELWLKDETVKFVADEETIDNVNPENGELIDKSKPRSYTRCVVDEDGWVRGRFVRRFPHWRVVVVASKRVLMNCPNPFDCETPPYIFFIGYGKQTKALSVGIGSYILILDKKLNDGYKRIMRSLQANIERPTIMDQNTFEVPKKWSNIPLLADAIVQIRSSAQKAYKLEAAELPLFVLPFLMMLEKYLAKITGIPQILQGQLTEGSQVGANTMSGLQESGAATLRLHAKAFKEPLKEVGRIGCCFIRQFYPKTVSYIMIDPSDFSKHQVTWDKEEDATDDYDIQVDVGSALPGARDGAYKQMMELYKQDIADAQAVCVAGKIPGWQEMLKRKKQQDLEFVKAEALGKATGVSIKDAMKAQKKNPAGTAGRISE